MLPRTFMPKEENIARGPKVPKERLTLLHGDNATADFKLKPLLVYKSETSRAMKNISKENIPVVFKIGSITFLPRKKKNTAKILDLIFYIFYFFPTVYDL